MKRASRKPARVAQFAHRVVNHPLYHHGHTAAHVFYLGGLLLDHMWSFRGALAVVLIVFTVVSWMSPSEDVDKILDDAELVAD